MAFARQEGRRHPALAAPRGAFSAQNGYVLDRYRACRPRGAPAALPRRTFGTRAGSVIPAAHNMARFHGRKSLPPDRPALAKASAGRRARSWAAVKSISGPAGTIPLGFTDSWLP